MPRFPYMSFPFPFYKNSPKAPNGFYSTPEPIINTSQAHSVPIASMNANHIPKTDSRKLSVEDRNKKNKSNINTCDYLFDLFGLKIYSDDVLLVSLIYFLYSEGVKDDGLFLVLVLLLLS